MWSKKWMRNLYIFILTQAVWLAACGLLPPAEEATPTPPPPTLAVTLADTAADNLARLQAADIPPRDQIALAQRYKGVQPVPHPAVPRDPAVPAPTEFWYKEQENDTNVRITARPIVATDEVVMWVEEGVDVDEEAVATAAQRLATEIFPLNRDYFGTEQRPGIDGDERLHILHIGEMGGNTIGYFSAADAFPPAVNPYSNQRDMFYINLGFVEIGDDAYYDVVAHEMQHMIHWHIDVNETIWINEGLAELAAAINGFGPSDHVEKFLTDPDTPLTYFDYEGGDYGAAYLFADYFAQRFGEEALKMLVRHPENGIDGVEATLRDLGSAVSFDRLFADWVAANYLDSHGLTAVDRADDLHYETADFPAEIHTTTMRPGEETHTAVGQYATDYVRVTGGQPLTVSFTGSRQVPLLDTAAHSGDFMWTTIPADVSNVHLTRSFDLTAVPTATLSFYTWYEIELSWDYAYVAASVDGGERWQPLQTIATNEADPHGNNLGRGYTGTSGGRDMPEWRRQTADLTPFVGHDNVLIRFEYVTDAAVHKQGFAVDDIAIPEIGYAHDAENGDDRWRAVGFVRHTNALPQTFVVQQILRHADGTATVSHLPLNEVQAGQWRIPLSEETPTAVLAVSATTPVTFQPAGYRLNIQENERSE